MSDKLRIQSSLRILASLTAFVGSFALGACFDGLDSTGLPCTNDDQCGTKNSCIEGFCGGMFACADGELVVEDELCDGKLDCPDGSDEDFERCFGDAEPFECDDGTLIPADLVCNSTEECADASDEAPTMCVGVGVNSCEAPGGDLGYALGPTHAVMPGPSKLALGDLVGPPTVDVVTIGGAGDQLTIVSIDEGSFGPEIVLDEFGVSQIVDFELGLANDDSMTDLVVATTGTDPDGTDAGIYVYARGMPMTPPALFGAPSVVPGLLDAQVMGIELGSFDLDDASDIVVIVDGAVKGRGVAAVGDPAAAAMGGAYFQFAPQDSFTLDYETFLDSAMTDIDDDGDSDLLVTSITDGKGVLWIVKRSGEGGQGPVEWDPPQMQVTPFPGRELALGQLSTMAVSDDLVLLDTMSGDLQAFVNQEGSLTPRPPLSAVTGSQLSGLTVADMNCDGFADYLLNVENPAEVRVYLGDGLGGLVSDEPIIYASGGTPRGDLAVFPADNDSTPDIVAAVDAGDGVGTAEVRLLVTAEASN
ncbi:LDL receptor domain-containing protein [Enhygromyxa salina]|uniref:Low-density lipoprotein receptor domain class A n=1 Tax=Enhygromyxa salina TaxID=215803 RepID=A0A2S9YDS1_9BACT|nr:LDL receptor domain-containing protein [Enhygromyxa salina]PRQ03182.1 Low-density lipoprotein receptor domain class A [Enhygromyxa salina]